MHQTRNTIGAARDDIRATGSHMASNIPTRRPAIVYGIPLLIIALGAAWLAMSLKSGKVVVDSTGVTIVAITHPADGERNVPLGASITAELNSGHMIDAETLTAHSVKLFRVSDRDPVA